MTVLDDMYDGYSFIEELESFTEAILRLDSSCMNQLPDYMKLIYQIVLDTIQEFEQDLANEGRSNVVYLLRKELKVTCEAYLQEARWCKKKCVPMYDAYMRNAIGSSLGNVMVVGTFLGMRKIATKDIFEWIRQYSKAFKASCIHCGLLNDMAGHKFEQKRNQVASAVECYMENFSVSEEEAYNELEQQVVEAWMDLKAEMLRPTSLPMPLFTRVLNISKALYDIYQIDEDGFTMPESIKSKIEALLIEPVVI